MEIARRRRGGLSIPDRAVEASFHVRVDVQAFHNSRQAHRFVESQLRETLGVRDGEELQLGKDLGEARLVDDLEMFQETEVMLQQSQGCVVQQEVTVVREKMSRSA